MSSLFPDNVSLRNVLPALLLVLLAAPRALQAQEAALTPSLAMKQEFNDNVGASVTNRGSDYITTLTPSLSYRSKTERGEASASGGLSALHYLEGTRNDSVGAFLRGSGRYAATPLVSLSADLGYVRDNSASTFDPGTAKLIGSRVERQNYRAGVSRQLDEVSAATLQLSYGSFDYANRAYFDSEYWEAAAALEYRLDTALPRLMLVPKVGFRRDRTSQSRVDDLSAQLAASFAPHELWSFTLAAGVHYNRSRFEEASGLEAENDGVSGRGKAVLSYAGERSSGNLSLTRALEPNANARGTTEVTSGSITLQRRFDEAFSGSVTGGYSWSKSDEGEFAAHAVDERSRSVGASLLYDINRQRDLTLEARYSYHATEYRKSDTLMEQNAVMLQLTWRHDFSR